MSGCFSVHGRPRACALGRGGWLPDWLPFLLDHGPARAIHGLSGSPGSTIGQPDEMEEHGKLGPTTTERGDSCRSRPALAGPS